MYRSLRLNGCNKGTRSGSRILRLKSQGKGDIENIFSMAIPNTNHLKVIPNIYEIKIGQIPLIEII